MISGSTISRERIKACNVRCSRGLMLGHITYLRSNMILVFLLLLLAAVPSSLVVAAEPDPILQHYIELALAQNPSLAAERSRAEAAGQVPSQESALPDPMLGFGVREIGLNDPIGHATSMSGKYVSLEQDFPFPGTLRGRRDRARAMQQVSAAMAEKERVRLISDVKQAYYEWAYVRFAADLLRENRALMVQLLAQSVESYKVGMASQSDVLRAQTEIVRFDNELSELRQMERTAVAALNTRCSLPPDIADQVPLPLKLEAADVSEDTLWLWVERLNPEIVAAAAQVESARLNRDLARRMYYPMFSLGAEYMQRHGVDSPENMISFMGGMTIPLYWWKKQSPLLQQRRIELRQRTEEQQNVINDVHRQLADLTARASSLREQIERYDSSIVPQAEQTFAAAQAGYIAGKVDFMTLLSSQMLVLDSKRDRAIKTAEYLKTWATIEALTGRQIL
jgi:cobalt-zinc-cadmium efflux system outer membrane protein